VDLIVAYGLAGCVKEGATAGVLALVVIFSLLVAGVAHYIGWRALGNHFKAQLVAWAAFASVATLAMAFISFAC
jgi:hypothetical protein